MTVINLSDDGEFATVLENAGSKLIVVDFFATWCGPCIRIAPKFEELSNIYSKVVFVKVDVDQCQELAIAEGVTAMPTFIFYRNKVKVEQIRGADTQALELKIKDLQDQTEGPDEGTESAGLQGNVDLNHLINKSASECLNESDEHPFANSLTGDDNYLESDVDEQLIISLGFNQAVKLHSIKFSGPPDSGPKNVKLFINHPNTLDFDQGDSMEPTQAISLKPEDLVNGGVVLPLRFVKFQNVQNIQIFIADNQSGTEITRIDHLVIYGRPVSTTNMSDFKRVAGKKGESH